MTTRYQKVLLIGVDGMDWDLTIKLVQDGMLPVFKKISEAGTFAGLNSSYPPQSPVAWASIATGVNPGKHNIFDFVKRNLETYRAELALPTPDLDPKSYIRPPPFWRITTAHGISTTVLRWPLTFPPEQVSGNLLSGYGVPDLRGFISGYTLYRSSKDQISVQPSNRVVQIEANTGVISTAIFGPKLVDSRGIFDYSAPLQIAISDELVMLTTHRQYTIRLNEWSDWIEVNFEGGVQGIFKVYLISREPFEMYATAVQIDPRNPMFKISSPDSYSRSLAEKIGLYYTLGQAEETEGLADRILSPEAFWKQVMELQFERRRMFWHEFSNFRQKQRCVFGFVFEALDRVQHMFLDQKDPKMANSSINQYVLDYYAQMDKFVGKVVEQIEDDTLLLVFSDHGSYPLERLAGINRWLIENGFMTRTSVFKQDEETSSFSDVDWSKTKAYAIGFNSIYVNLRGRERHGIVEDRSEVVEDIVAKLQNFVDETTKKKVVHRAYRREEIYSGEFVENAPDIIIGFNPEYRMGWQTAIGGIDATATYPNPRLRLADHLSDPAFVPGVLFSNARLREGPFELVDICPTLLDALGLSVPETMDGKSLLK